MPEVEEKPDVKEEPKVSTEVDNKPAPTPEEIEALAKENMAEFFDNDRLEVRRKPAEQKDDETFSEKISKSKEEKPKPEDKATDKPKAKAPEKKADAPVVEEKAEEKPEEKKEEKKPEPKAEKPKPVLEDEDYDAVADRVAERLKPKPIEKPDVPKVDPLAGYDRGDRNKLEALKYLSATDPRFKGRDLVSETTKFWTAEQAYIAKWEKENAGETFNPEEAEHKDFYGRNEPKGISDDDIEEARLEIKVDGRMEKLERKANESVEERLKPIERDRVLAEKMPVVMVSVAGAIKDFVKEVMPDFVGDEEKLTNAIVDKIKAEDPVAMDLLNQEAKVLDVRVRELELMRHTGKHFDFDEKKIVKVGNQKVTPHADIVQTALDLEEALLNLPENEQQREDGRNFMARAERAQKIQSIIRSNITDEEKSRRIQALDKRFYTIDLDDIREAFVQQSSLKVKETLEIATKRQAHIESKKASKAEKPEPEKSEKTEEKPEKKNHKPAPSIAAESDQVNSRVPGSSKATENIESVVKDWF